MEDLEASDIAILRQYSYKLRHHLTDAAYRDLPFAMPDSHIPSLEIAQTRIAHLAGFKPEIFDCCPNVCMCYTGPYAEDDQCRICHTPRYSANGRARKRFTYLPLIPRLKAMLASRAVASKMTYRAEGHKPVDGEISDFMDSKRYQRLKREYVVINHRTLPHKFFQDGRDVAFGLSTDGFAPFRRRKSTCWPLILFNYNLPPEIRFHFRHIISLGVIPGPKKPVDIDSFLWPLVQEFVDLAAGITAFDALSETAFVLRAYLVLVFGDIPAVSLLMKVKGHNGFSPCRICKITAVRTPGSDIKTLYVPLDRSRHPEVLRDPSALRSFDARNLPLRTHKEMLRMAEEVQTARTGTERELLAKLYGIKGVPILSRIPSISLSKSFPYGFMHLLWENTMKNLISLWTGDFKGLDVGSGTYQFEKQVWDAIGDATAASGSTIPSCYTSARPPNVASNRSATTADSWSFWTLFLGPVLLRRRFTHQKYYDHFVDLVVLLHICLQFTITAADIVRLREGFALWVEKFEE